MKHLTYLLLAVGLAWPAPGQAADGDGCATTGRQSKRGWTVHCNLVCDTKVAANTTCSTFTIAEAADTYILEIATATTCDAGNTIDVDTLGITGTAEHDLTVLEVGDVDQVVIDGSAAHPLTQLDFDLTLTGCTDLDVKLWRFYKQGD